VSLLTADRWFFSEPSWPGLTRPSSVPTMDSMKKGFVYIMANKRNGTIYIGVTSNLRARARQHKKGRGGEFTRKYDLQVLVWYEAHASIVDAIQRETSLKRWPRKWKLELIERMNPGWVDLHSSLE
jgi:putative endonuclease